MEPDPGGLSFPEWLILLSSLATAFATIVLAIVAGRTLRVQQRTHELGVRVALLDHRLGLLEDIRSLVTRATQEPGSEELVAQELGSYRDRVLYLFGRSDAEALDEVERAVLNLVPFRKVTDIGGGSSMKVREGDGHAVSDLREALMEFELLAERELYLGAGTRFPSISEVLDSLPKKRGRRR